MSLVLFLNVLFLPRLIQQMEMSALVVGPAVGWQLKQKEPILVAKIGNAFLLVLVFD